MDLGAVEGVFFAVVVLDFAVWQIWSLRDRD